METSRTSSGIGELLLKALGIGFGFWLVSAARIDGRVAAADDNSTHGTQNPGRVGVAHAAEIFPQADVQAVVQATLNDPVISFHL